MLLVKFIAVAIDAELSREKFQQSESLLTNVMKIFVREIIYLTNNNTHADYGRISFYLLQRYSSVLTQTKHYCNISEIYTQESSDACSY